MMQQPLFP
jgi:hypothetical protein